MPTSFAPPSFARYLLAFGASLATVLLIVWVYVALAPMAFMESGYAAWAAKSTMLRECRLGEIAFFGDSRLEAGVIPADLPVPARNFALPAATAIEVASAVQKATACPTVPRQAVLTLIPDHFGAVEYFFWTLSLRYDFISAPELAALETRAAALGDTVTFATATPDGLGGRLRDWLYALNFPSFSFGSLVQGRIAGRYATNRAHYDEVLRQHGWTRYVGNNGGRAIDPTFHPTRLQMAEFERAITRLRERGVAVGLLVMPFSQSSPPPAGVAGPYLAYLRSLTERFAGVHLIDGAAPIWPDRLFGDGSHLLPEGARALSARLAACVVDGMIKPGCDLEWHPETASGSPVLEVQQQGHR